VCSRIVCEHPGRVHTVTESDTFRLESGERIRIANIDAPETRAGQASAVLKSRSGSPRPNAPARCSTTRP
jgi:endonuclease YncB( thermonuclease family)